MNSTTSRSHIDVHLIKKALALTGKPYSTISISDDGINWIFSIEKFGWYLLSPGFINEYIENGKGEVYPRGFEDSPRLLREDIARAIYNYQSGDSSKLINLLSKI